MALDIENPEQFTRLVTAVRLSREALGPYRQQRTNHIRQYVGSNYGENGVSERLPTNFVELIVNVFGRHLLPRRPAVSVTTPYRERLPLARLFELALNQLMEQNDFEDEMRAVTTDALFRLGMVKIGLVREPRIGTPAARHVDFDDVILDMSASNLRTLRFLGNRYDVPLDWARDYEGYDQEERERLAVASRIGTGQREERANEIQTRQRGDETELEDLTELIDLWLPEEKKLITMSGGGNAQAPLRMIETTHLRHGPYRLLRFNCVPGNIMPLGVVPRLIDLHDLANLLFVKIADQADRQKTVTVVQKGYEADAERIKEAQDQDIIGAERTDNVATLKFGGADPNTVAAYLQAKGELDYFAGNLNTLGGLTTSADTATQERLLAANSSTQLQALQSDEAGFISDVVADLGWLLWNDSFTTYRLVEHIPGVNRDVIVTLKPEQRIGSFQDYGLKVDPYSLQHRTPQERLGLLTQTVSPLMNLAPILAQQGLQIDFRAFIRAVAKLSQVDELNEIIVPAPPQVTQQMQEGGGLEMPRMPQSTTRNYVRRNVPGASRQGQDQIMARMLAARGVQPSEAANMNRIPGV